MQPDDTPDPTEPTPNPTVRQPGVPEPGVPEPGVPEPALPVPGANAPAHGGRLWWVIVGSVALLAVLVAGITVALQPSAPSSADELQKLLIAPGGGTGFLSPGILLPKPSTPGVRWTVSRAWSDDGRNSGVVSLTQYETTDQAQAALTSFADQTQNHQPVPGHPGAFYLPGPKLNALGRSVQSGVAVGVKHTVLAFVAGTGDSPDVFIRLLAEQLDRLP